MPDRDPMPGSDRPPAPQAGGGDPVTVRTGSGAGRVGPASGPTGRGSSHPGRAGGGGSAEVAAAVPIPLPRPGGRIDVFDLEAAIGAGGMGAVFRASDSRLDRVVALKVLPPDQAVDPEVVLRFHQEGRAAARLDHENIARVYTIGDDGRYHYIVFEYIEGTTIRQRVERDGPLPVADAINFTLQIANALVHAAGRGVIHRDIKPSNIIVTPQGRAKLVDMGLARRFERGEDGGLTQSGMTLGTFDYISPEQARDPRDVDVRGDLYSLGCTLYHMLSGRPPFPDGTVLQKLLQHQEERATDIRKLNPAVPDDLAAIGAKLMAKDRDRRYQTPEQLVRDLLTMAGSLGLRSTNPEGLVWMAPAPAAPPAWIRHAVWAVPATAFLAIFGALALLGDGPGPLPPSLADAPSAPALPVGPGPISAPSTGRTRPTLPPEPRPTAAPTPAVVAAPREFSVGPDQDLIRALADAPPRSTVILSSKGPYELRGSRARRLVGLDLMIKAEAGIRPVIRLPREPGIDPGPTEALLEVVGGRVAFDGIEFVVDGDGDRAEAPAALRIEGGEVSARRCGFRRVGPAPAGSKPAAIRIGPGPRDPALPIGLAADRAATLMVDASDFDGSQAAILATGPVDVSIRDATFGPAPADLATFWAENPEGGAVPVAFRLSHASVLAGPGPVFRFEGAAPRVRVAESAFGPPASPPLAPPATLVSIDVPDRLDWRGSDNLYARIALYLRPGGLSQSGPKRAEVRSFAAWADDPASPRESGSTGFAGHPWDERNPLDTLAMAPGRGEPSRAFRLSLPRVMLAPPGARQGPNGPLPPPTTQVGLAVPAPNQAIAEIAQAPPSPPATPPTSTEPPTTGMARLELPRAPNPGPARPLPGVGRLDPASASPSPPAPNDPTRRGSPTAPGRAAEARDDEFDDLDLVPMPRPADPELMPMPGPAASPATAAEAGPWAMVGPPAPPAVAVAVEGPPAPVATLAPPPIRTADQFLDALDRAGTGPRTLVLAGGADLTLPPRRLKAGSTWTIRAEAGPNLARPRVRFRPDPVDPLGGRGASAWLTLNGGGFRLEGVDLLVVMPEEPPRGSAGPTSAFAIQGGAELTLVDCTATIDGSKAPSSLVALPAQDDPGGSPPAGFGPGPKALARVRVEDSLLRLGGDGFDIGGGRAVELALSNVAIATHGALVHGRGVAEGRARGPIRLTIRRVAARIAGGLVRLESTAGLPDLPRATMVAAESVLATVDPDAPLLRVDGQGDLDALRDRVDWEGRSVAYHQVAIYRRDRTDQPGVAPRIFDRDDWELAVGPAEEAPIHGDLKFLADWPADRPPWALRPGDLRLGPASPAAALGPDYLRIPDPPMARGG